MQYETFNSPLKMLHFSQKFGNGCVFFVTRKGVDRLLLPRVIRVMRKMKGSCTMSLMNRLAVVNYCLLGQRDVFFLGKTGWRDKGYKLIQGARTEPSRKGYLIVYLVNNLCQKWLVHCVLNCNRKKLRLFWNKIHNPWSECELCLKWTIKKCLEPSRIKNESQSFSCKSPNELAPGCSAVSPPENLHMTLDPERDLQRVHSLIISQISVIEGLVAMCECKAVYSTGTRLPFAMEDLESCYGTLKQLGNVTYQLEQKHRSHQRRLLRDTKYGSK